MGYQSYGGHSDRETPGPIPNPEVKPASADGTAPERWWESRTPPNILSSRGHPAVASVALEGQTGSRDNPQHHSDDPEKVTTRGRPATRPASRPWIRQSSSGGRPQQRSSSSSGSSRGRPRRAPGTSATVTRRAVSAAPGPAVACAAARVTGRGRPRSRRPRTVGPGDVRRAADCPEEITGAELDRSVSGQLKGLPEKLAARVARHLAAAGMLIDDRPRDGLPAHAGRPGPRVAPGRGARGDRRGGVRRRPLRRGARRAARGQADERRHGVPADHGRLPPRARPPRAGAQAGQEPLGGQLRARRRRRR